MSLRAKLLTGYLVFDAALVLLAGWSAWRLREMGDVSRRIISNNYDSLIAAQEMKESLERLDKLMRDLLDLSKIEADAMKSGATDLRA